MLIGIQSDFNQVKQGISAFCPFAHVDELALKTKQFIDAQNISHRSQLYLGQELYDKLAFIDDKNIERHLVSKTLEKTIQAHGKEELLIVDMCAFDESIPLRQMLRHIDASCSEKGLSFIALYCREKLSSEYLLVASESHPYIAVDFHLLPNPYFRPFDDNNVDSILEERLNMYRVFRSMHSLAKSNDKTKTHSIAKELHSRVAEVEKLGFLSAIVEQAPDAIAYLDKKFRIRYTNPSTSTLLRCSVPELYNNHFSVLFENAVDIEPSAKQALRDQNVYSKEIHIKRKDGSLFWGFLSISSLSKMQSINSIEGYIVRITDISEKKKANAMLAQNDRLASIGLLAAGVAHEINNPLTFISLNLESLSEELPELKGIDADKRWELAKSAEVANSGAKRIAKIVNDLNTFSRIDENKEAISLHACIDKAVNLVSNEIRFKAALVRDYSKLPEVFANEGKLCQVFVNLLINAAQSISENDIDNNKIEITTYRKNDYACVTIKDTGSGIAHDNRLHIFDPFFSTKQAGEGSGLGLTICRNHLKSMGGTIEYQLRDEPLQNKRGAAFLVKIPIVVKKEKEKDTATFVKLHRNGRFLAIDDEPQLLDIYRRLFTKEHELITARSGALAIEILQTDPNFDCIICDVIMPEISGIDIYNWLLEKDPKLIKKLLFVSGGSFTNKTRSFQAQVDAPFLQKPFSTNELFTWINKIMC